MMNPVRKKRLISLAIIALGVSSALAMAMYALRDNINLFYTPYDIVQGKVMTGERFRIGGMVQKGSLQRDPANLDVTFVLDDKRETVRVHYRGILPDLFREGQGIVANGELNSNGEFIAKDILAKHDADYMPPEVKQALEKNNAVNNKARGRT